MSSTTADEGLSEPTSRQQGVPETLTKALSMSRTERMQAITNLYLYLEDMTVHELAHARNSDGEIEFESLLGLDLYTQMTAHLGETPLQLTEFEHTTFQTLAGIEELVRRAYLKLEERSNAQPEASKTPTD